jgi:hypothetical protein
MQRVLLGQMELLCPKVLLGHVARKRRETMRATAETRPIEGAICQR